MVTCAGRIVPTGSVIVRSTGQASSTTRQLCSAAPSAGGASGSADASASANHIDTRRNGPREIFMHTI